MQGWLVGKRHSYLILSLCSLTFLVVSLPNPQGDDPKKENHIKIIHISGLEIPMEKVGLVKLIVSL